MAGPHRSARDRPPRRAAPPPGLSLSHSRSTTNNQSDHTHSSFELAPSRTSCRLSGSPLPARSRRRLAPWIPPCIIQALRAHAPPPTTGPGPPGPAPLPSPSPPARRRILLPATEAPEWTRAETLALVAEVDDGWSRSVSAFQKWAVVAENLASASDAPARRGKRAAADCRRRWEALAAEYGDGSRHGGGGGGIGAAVEVGEEDNGGEAEVAEDGGKEEDESADEEEGEDDDDGQEMHEDDDAPKYSEGRVVETNNKTENSKNTAWELANKLQENAQHIQTILNEEPDEYAAQNHAVAYSTSPDAMEKTRQKADGLIKSLDGLLSYLNQFTEGVKETGFENVGMT
ncbi:hypothetical protein QOZ80_2BG0160520 [Eleusine coracana subsp. coracana]|nr:hypothetical protein QOZ80_2BG0160520 [Eleusine coracana subsp. coracana]